MPGISRGDDIGLGSGLSRLLLHGDGNGPGLVAQCVMLTMKTSGMKRPVPDTAGRQPMPKRWKRLTSFGVLGCVCVWSTLLGNTEEAVEDLLSPPDRC